MTAERIGAGDLVEWLTDVGPAPKQVGGVLVLDGTPRPAHVQQVLVERLARLPRFTQRLQQDGSGRRPRWVPSAAPVHERVTRATCPAPGDDDAVLALATAAVTEPLDRGGPLWRALVVDGLVGGAVAVVLVLHHVLADGLGGLSVLARLVDAEPVAEPVADPAVRPGARTAAGPPVTSVGAPDAPPAVPGQLAASVRARHRLGAPRTSLNVPTGPRRVTVAVDVDLAHVKAAGRTQGATVNDVLLLVAAGSSGRLLRGRGEDVDALVVSVAVATRAPDAAHRLGNHVGVMPVRVPLHGPAAARLASVARSTRRRKGHARRTSTALVRPLFRLTVATGLYRWAIDRQRLVNVFLTNLRGPAQRLSLAGAPVRRAVPLVVGTGNVPLAVAALSHAGVLTVAVDVDPDAVPEVEAFAVALRAELDDVLALAAPPAEG